MHQRIVIPAAMVVAGLLLSLITAVHADAWAAGHYGAALGSASMPLLLACVAAAVARRILMPPKP